MRAILLHVTVLVCAVLIIQGCDDVSENGTGNGRPVAYSDTVITALDTAVDIQVRADDPEGDVLTFNMNTTPMNGAIYKTSIDTWRYTPETGYSGDDSFTFRANDGTDDSNPGTISIHVGQSTDQPLASGQTVNIYLGESVRITLEAVDPSGFSLE